MTKDQYIQAIIDMINETNDTITLALIYNILNKTSLKKTS